jgi:hypothetical protein
MLIPSGSKHVVIYTNVNNFRYYFYLNCYAVGYKYTVLCDTEHDATRKAEKKTRLTLKQNKLL